MKRSRFGGGGRVEGGGLPIGFSLAAVLHQMLMRTRWAQAFAHFLVERNQGWCFEWQLLGCVLMGEMLCSSWSQMAGWNSCVQEP